MPRALPISDEKKYATVPNSLQDEKSINYRTHARLLSIDDKIG